MQSSKKSMKTKTVKSSALRVFWASVLIGTSLTCSMAHADESDEVSKLIQAEKYDQALARADAYLANKPNDAQMRFLKGLILTERKQIDQAISVFKKLTEDYPELPEPYNNLAVLYAGRGEYEQAEKALEMAIRTHPSYATAHENLGDVYAKLASQSYDKALQLDGKNSTAKMKLSLIRKLISGNPVPGTEPEVVASAAPAKTAATSKAPSPAPTPVPTPAPTPAPVQATKPTAVAVAPAIAASAPKVTASTPAITAVAPKPTVEKPSGNTIGMDSQVLAAVEKWAKAWSDQDMEDYLGAYSKEFNPPGNMTRAAWEKMRKERIVGKETIRVVVDNPLITIKGDEAVVKFKQSYFSNRLNNVSTKVLDMKREGGAWKITNERVGG